MQNQQLSLDLIHHNAGGAIVDQRAQDGYINATAMCEAVGKAWAHYWSNATTQAFITELATDIGIPTSALVQSVRGGITQGTWVHPQVATHLGQWLSPKFAVQVSKWIHAWMISSAATARATTLPVHLQRYMANDSKVPPGHFSILQETGVSLFGPLHMLGFDIPKGWVPDISVGKLFCTWLRDTHGVNPDTFPYYEHDYLDGRPMVFPHAYPDEYLALYRTWFRTVWLPQHGRRYFKSKDPRSVGFLDRMPALAAPAAVPRIRQR